jgi:Phage protein Gp138 N-terminal domain
MTPDEMMPPNLKIILDEVKADIFSTFNCVQIGKISKVTSSEQTVEIELQIRRLAADGTSTKYPLLVDCPYFVLQGGGAYIDMPIKAGDYCLVLFNDRNIDNWWSTANVADPATARKHSLSDALAIVGINPKTSPLAMDGTKLRIINDDGIELNGNSKQFVTWAELNSALQTFVGAINTLFASKSNGSGTAGTLSLDISAAKTTTIKTGG